LESRSKIKYTCTELEQNITEVQNNYLYVDGYKLQSMHVVSLIITLMDRGSLDRKNKFTEQV
jgi:hypothetical protein